MSFQLTRSGFDEIKRIVATGAAAFRRREQEAMAHLVPAAAMDIVEWAQDMIRLTPEVSPQRGPVRCVSTSSRGVLREFQGMGIKRVF